MTITWEGDLTDDCTCRAGNLLAHCENMGPIKWRCVDDGRKLYDAEIWFCLVARVDDQGFIVGDPIFHSGDYGGLITSGELARAISETILKAAAQTNPKSNMTDELFPSETVTMDSPKLAWLKKHGLTTSYAENVGDAKDEFGNQAKPWTCAKIILGGRCIGSMGYGDTEEDACADFAEKYDLLLWNEEAN
jgi:hypothetical protein